MTAPTIPRKVVPYTGPPIIEGQEHFKDCPCGRCQAIRAARPQPTQPTAVYLCCGATMRLTPIPGGWTGTVDHLKHCPEQGAFSLPKTKEET